MLALVSVGPTVEQADLLAELLLIIMLEYYQTPFCRYIEQTRHPKAKGLLPRHSLAPPLHPSRSLHCAVFKKCPLFNASTTLHSVLYLIVNSGCFGMSNTTYILSESREMLVLDVLHLFFTSYCICVIRCVKAFYIGECNQVGTFMNHFWFTAVD